jgi:membrane associated rhomboid family serine protease
MFRNAPEPNPSWRGAVAFAVGFVLWTVAAQAWSDHIVNLQFERVRYAAGAAWMLFSAQWVHLGVAHAALNGAMLALMVLALQGWVPLRMQWAALAGGYAGVAITIALDPHCLYYAGSSGALHGLWAGSAFFLSARHRMERTDGSVWLGAAMLLALVFKLGWQAWKGDSGVPANATGGLHLLGGMATYFPAHVGGALGGAVVSLLAIAFLRPTVQERRAPPQAPTQQ